MYELSEILFQGNHFKSSKYTHTYMFLWNWITWIWWITHTRPTSLTLFAHGMWGVSIQLRQLIMLFQVMEMLSKELRDYGIEHAKLVRNKSLIVFYFAWIPEWYVCYLDVLKLKKYERKTSYFTLIHSGFWVCNYMMNVEWFYELST